MEKLKGLYGGQTAQLKELHFIPATAEDKVPIPEGVNLIILDGLVSHPYSPMQDTHTVSSSPADILNFCMPAKQIISCIHFVALLALLWVYISTNLSMFLVLRELEIIRSG